MKTLPFQTKCLRATETDSRMQRLQMAAEISEKAASEMVEQKMTELMTSQRRIESLLAECEHLKSELQESNEKNGKLHHNNTQLVAEKAELRESFREMLLDWEEQEDDSKRAAVKTANLREQTQRLTLENRRLRKEIEGHINLFHGRQRDFQEKVQLLKELMEATDVFDLLRKRLELAEHRIKYLEDAHSMAQDNEQALRFKILQLLQETRIAEAVARSYYLKHRGCVLQDQLRVVGEGLSHSEYYMFAKVLIERHGWIFREMEMVHRERQLPWWDELLKEESKIPFRSQLYPPSAVDGGEPWTVTLGTTIDRPPEKRYPH
eukprot:GHVN01013833.1.p1 GENE.GHVN01013833.1~~GHVN01013833.1.p1  ORF type:complete len:321 (+),score=51.85 GHVN01013833.1:1109-2071(+)